MISLLRRARSAPVFPLGCGNCSEDQEYAQGADTLRCIVSETTAKQEVLDTIHRSVSAPCAYSWSSLQLPQPSGKTGALLARRSRLIIGGAGRPIALGGVHNLNS